jgi:hypothetical protein
MPLMLTPSWMNYQTTCTTPYALNSNYEGSNGTFISPENCSLASTLPSGGTFQFDDDHAQSTQIGSRRSMGKPPAARDGGTSSHNCLSSQFVPWDSYGAYQPVHESSNSTRPITSKSLPTGVTSILLNCRHCSQIFKRHKDRRRHESTKHENKQYLCHIAGCPRGQLPGYSRKDKLTHHMWRDHSDLGYRKRA